MSDGSLHTRIAETLFAQRKNGELVRLPEGAGLHADESAYLVQAQATRHRLSHQDVQTGYKIACTTPAAQQAVGRSAPAVAPIFESGDITGTGSIAVRSHYPLGVECELALVIGRDVGQQDDVVAAVTHAAVGCEIVEDRYGGIGTAGSACLIADGFAHRAYSLGPLRNFDVGAFHVDALRASVCSEQTVLAAGQPGSGMANPLTALKWLHLMLADRGIGLRAGDIVLTGAIAPPLWLKQPCTLTLELHPLGRIEITVGPAAEETAK